MGAFSQWWLQNVLRQHTSTCQKAKVQGCKSVSFFCTNMIQVDICMYFNAISDRFSTWDFPLSVFLVKMWLVVVWVLAPDLSKKASARS
jgi:hypothetical protein